MNDVALVLDGVVVAVARYPVDAAGFGDAPGERVEMAPGSAFAGMLWNGSALSEPAVAAPTMNELFAYALALRWETEVSGILFDGHPVPTDDRGKLLVSGAYQKAAADAGVTKDWQVSNSPIAFVTLSNAQLVALGLAVDAFVQATFDALKAVSAAITAETITTTAQIDAAFAGIQRVYTTPA